MNAGHHAGGSPLTGPPQPQRLSPQHQGVTQQFGATQPQPASSSPVQSFAEIGGEIVSVGASLPELVAAEVVPPAKKMASKTVTTGASVSRLGISSLFKWIWGAVTTSFAIFWWVLLIGVLAAIPIVQFLAYGYLLRVSGNLAAGGKFRDAIPHLKAASKIGLALTAIALAALPSQLFANFESAARVVSPESSQATINRFVAFFFAFSALLYLSWAWARGGSIWHYLWPQPKRVLRDFWRLSFWNQAVDRLWDFFVELQIPSTTWLGIRGALATFIWLIPATIVMGAFRQGETGAAGFIGVLAVIALGIGIQYLPMLQTHFATQNRFRAMFEVSQVRRDFKHAPWAYLMAMIAGLLIFPIPLYLLKIEATPAEVVFLPCFVMVAFLLPARIAEGWAIRRARFRMPNRKMRKAGDYSLRPREMPTGIWAGISRWTARALMPGVIAIYLLFVYVSQYTSWDGYETWIQQHAVLLPIPFLEGV